MNKILTSTFVIILFLTSCSEDYLTPEQTLHNLEVTPNPIRNKFDIIINGKVSAEINYELLDAYGRSLQTGNFTVDTKDQHIEEIEAYNLAQGQYILTITIDDEIINKKLIRKTNTNA